MERKISHLSTTWVQESFPGVCVCVCVCVCVHTQTSYLYLHMYSITFGLSIGLSAVVLIVERNEGLIDRTWVAGVNVPEIIISQVVTQFFILLVQITLLVVVVIFGFKVRVHCIAAWSPALPSLSSF